MHCQADSAADIEAMINSDLNNVVTLKQTYLNRRKNRLHDHWLEATVESNPDKSRYCNGRQQN